jgi:hypothetical protein
MKGLKHPAGVLCFVFLYTGSKTEMLSRSLKNNQAGLLLYICVESLRYRTNHGCIQDVSFWGVQEDVQDTA